MSSAVAAVLAGIIVLLTVALGVLLKQYDRHLALRHQRGLFGAWPLRPSPPDAHARSFVESDTEKALRMVRPGGCVVWHDYRGPKRTLGVFQALNALARTHDLTLIAGTSLVVWRAPGSTAGSID